MPSLEYRKGSEETQKLTTMLLLLESQGPQADRFLLCTVGLPMSVVLSALLSCKVRNWGMTKWLTNGCNDIMAQPFRLPQAG